MLQNWRENILPSERAFAYKMKLEAVKHQGERSDLTSRQVVGKLEAVDIVGENPVRAAGRCSGISGLRN